MNKTRVRLTTEIFDLGRIDSTNIFPYDYVRTHRKLDVSDKKQIVIHEFDMTNPSRVEIHWGNEHETTNILYGNQTIDIPPYCHSIIFTLDPFNWNTLESRNDRIAEFEFEII